MIQKPYFQGYRTLRKLVHKATHARYAELPEQYKEDTKRERVILFFKILNLLPPAKHQLEGLKQIRYVLNEVEGLAVAKSKVKEPYLSELRMKPPIPIIWQGPKPGILEIGSTKQVILIGQNGAIQIQKRAENVCLTLLTRLGNGNVYLNWFTQYQNHPKSVLLDKPGGDGLNIWGDPPLNEKPPTGQIEEIAPQSSEPVEVIDYLC